ncbi:caspase family protein [Pseudophaeobacter sp.]|uniref:caspase family protein n=1 Tax=Pseudophaeobacter sp. TaxID=1971739 RepID=UPI00329712A3
MRQILALIFALFLATPASAARHAFILGNSDYAELGDLANTHADAEAYAKALGDLGFNVTLTKDLTRRQTLQAFYRFLNTVAPGDDVAFVYSGHGWSNGRVNYIVPTEVQRPQPEFQKLLEDATIPLQNGHNGLLDELEAKGVALTIAVIDACRDSPFLQTPGTKSIGVTRGLTPILPSTGTFIVYSAGKGQQALDHLPTDSPDQKLSVFTRNFVQHLKPGTYLQDAILDARRLTRQQAASYDGHQQLPAYYDQTTERICLAGQCGAAANPVDETPEDPVTSAALDQCSALFKVAQETNQCYAYSAYQTHCADHILAPVADAYMRLRCEAETVTASVPPQTRAQTQPEIQPTTQALATAQPEASPPETTVAEPAQEDATPEPDPVLALMSKHKGGGAAATAEAPAPPQNLTPATPSPRPAALTEPSLSAQQAALQSCADAAGHPRHPLLNGQRIASSGIEWKALNADQAIAACRRAEQLNPDTPMVQAFLARAYDKADNLPRALSYYREAAAAQDPMAQTNLGLMYRKGQGVTANDQIAVSWLRRAANQGYPIAETQLGWMYEKGRAVPQDDGQAVSWYRRAANQDHPRAQYNLGWMYENGRGVSQSHSRALSWYRRAAKSDYLNAIYKIGIFYREGRGITQDDREAVNWFRQAANQDLAKAQTSLGWMYEKGRGVPQDTSTALRWYRKAAAQGDATANVNLGVHYELGRGVTQNDQRAVAYYIEGLKLGSETPLGWSNGSWRQSTLRLMQRELRDMGLYSGSIDGKAGPGTHAAMRALKGR